MFLFFFVKVGIFLFDVGIGKGKIIYLYDFLYVCDLYCEIWGSVVWGKRENKVSFEIRKVGEDLGRFWFEN